MTWLLNNYGNIIVITLVLLLLYLCAKSIFGSKKSGCSSCGCGKSCAGCTMCNHSLDFKNKIQGRA